MRKVFLIFAAAGLMGVSACGNKTTVSTSRSNSGAGGTDSAADTLNTVEAVVRQVNAVYDFWNRQREQFDENNPQLTSLDEQFGTREWRQVNAQVMKIDRECECGGFFDFGEDGPLDAWLYDCFEGAVRADSIEARLTGEGQAEARFLVKDAVTIKGTPIRWTLRVEDGQWRVADIIFVANDDMDLLKAMKEYVAESGEAHETLNALPD